MSRRDERPKASDVFRDANLVFSKKVPFEEAFPEIADFRVEVEIGMGAHDKRSRVYTRASPPGEYIDCDKSLCYNGGFSIGSVFREMVSEHKTDHEGHSLCRGYEGSPKGKKKYRDCLNFFRYRVHIDYKVSESGDRAVGTL